MMTSGRLASGWAPLPKGILCGWICLSKDSESGRNRGWAAGGGRGIAAGNCWGGRGREMTVI